MTLAAARGIPRRFDEVSAVVADGSGRFSADVDAEWTIGGKPNGGYLLAMMGRAAAGTVDHHHVIAASAHYMHSPEPGPVGIDTEVLRSGRSVSQVRARMTQGDHACVEALITLSTLSAVADPHWSRPELDATAIPVGDPVRVGSVLPDGNRVAIMDQVEVLLDPDAARFTADAPSGRGVIIGWLTLPGGEPFTTSSLLYALDALPPATFDIEYAGWVPTLELTAYIRAIPEPGPLRILQRANLIADRRVDETCLIWDCGGRIVAQGSQLAGIRLP
jgi:acyl-coenzyme A thioesterase PaaI-like protein